MKMTDSEFSLLHLGTFCVFCVHDMYSPYSKLPFGKHAKWQLRSSDN